MYRDDIQKLREKNKLLQEENEKLKKTSEGVHSISKAFAESNREKEKLKDTIRILTRQLSSVSSTSSATKSIDGSHSHSGAAEPELQISDNELLDLAGQLGTNWRSLAFRLDIQTGEVDAVKEQYSTPKQQIYQILKLWRQKRVHSADLRAQLSSALERTGHRDLAEKLQKDASEQSTVPSTYVLPWFFDIVSLECQGKEEWKTLGSNLKLEDEKLNEIERLPLGERIYGVLDNWLKCLLSGTNPLVVLVMALISSGRNDVAEKLKKASKERNEYIEEWSMQQESMISSLSGKQKHVRLKSPTISKESVFTQNDSLEGIESLKNSSTHPSNTDDIYTHDSVKSFGSKDSMKFEYSNFDSAESEQERHTSLSMLLKDIEHKCRIEHGSSELTKGLAKMLPKSIEQDKELKQLRTLRVATMDQHQRFKDEIEEKNQVIGDLRIEVNFLKNELEETKKVKQDEALRSFEVLTKGDASALKREEKLDVEMKQGAGVSDSKTQDSTVVTNLRKENLAMKKQIDEILKVNNEWDQHYAGMKSSFEAKLKKIEEDNMRVKENLDRKMKESLQRMAADSEKESILDKKQREFDQMLTQAKARIDTAEAEKVEHQNRSARLEKWVHMLLTQKTQSEGEIARLNQELEKAMRSAREFEVPLGAAAAYGAPQRNLIPRGIDNDVTQRMQEQIDLLQQQNMAFQSDFNQERRDRQHAVGQLTEAKEEIEALRKIAMDLQEQVNTDARKVKRPPGYRGYYIQEIPPGGKIIQHGVNYGGNDIEIDGPDGAEQQDPESECPVCQRVIPNKQELEQHVERCTNNFD